MENENIVSNVQEVDTNLASASNTLLSHQLLSLYQDKFEQGEARHKALDQARISLNQTHTARVEQNLKAKNSLVLKIKLTAAMVVIGFLAWSYLTR